eukprot:6118-Heterococcus_DN1.PRE.3
MPELQARAIRCATMLATDVQASLYDTCECCTCMQVGHTSCVFVNAHFAAHQNNVSERIEHYRQIQCELARALQAPENTPPKVRHLFSIAHDSSRFSSVLCIVDWRVLQAFVQATSAAVAQTVTINHRCAVTMLSIPASTLSATVIGVRTSGSSSSAMLAPLTLSTSLAVTATTALELSAVFDHVVWSGDLNFRINAPRQVADLLLQKVRLISAVASLSMTNVHTVPRVRHLNT